MSVIECSAKIDDKARRQTAAMADQGRDSLLDSPVLGRAFYEVTEPRHFAPGFVNMTRQEELFDKLKGNQEAICRLA